MAYEDRIKRLKAELVLAELEQTFVKAKESGGVDTEMKAILRAARRDFRNEFREIVAVSAAPVKAGSKSQKSSGGA